jgi:hypothetical protein
VWGQDICVHVRTRRFTSVRTPVMKCEVTVPHGSAAHSAAMRATSRHAWASEGVCSVKRQKRRDGGGCGCGWWSAVDEKPGVGASRKDAVVGFVVIAQASFSIAVRGNHGARSGRECSLRSVLPWLPARSTKTQSQSRRKGPLARRERPTLAPPRLPGIRRGPPSSRCPRRCGPGSSPPGRRSDAPAPQHRARRMP